MSVVYRCVWPFAEIKSVVTSPYIDPKGLIARTDESSILNQLLYIGLINRYEAYRWSAFGLDAAVF